MKFVFLVYWIAGVTGRRTEEIHQRNRIVPTKSVNTVNSNHDKSEGFSSLRSLQDQVDAVAMSHLRHIQPPTDTGRASFADTYHLNRKSSKATKASGYYSHQPGLEEDDYYYPDDNYADGYGGMDDEYAGDDYFSMYGDAAGDDYFSMYGDAAGDDYFSNYGDAEQGNDYDYLTKGSKRSKKSTKASKGYVKGSKKGYPQKKSKRTKYSKSKNDKKLRAPGDENVDDDWTTDDQYNDPEYGDDYWNKAGLWETDAPSAATEVSSVPTTVLESASNETTSTGRAHPRVGFASRQKTSSPTSSPLFPSDLLSARMGSSGQANETFATETTTPIEQPIIGSPHIERELFPNPVLLKAHSSVSLQEHQQAVFTETTNIVTTCLQRSYTSHLQAYKLTVEYSDGPDVSYAGVVITEIAINIVISVKTDTIDDLKLLNHESASKIARECFDGPPMYQLLGGLRRAGVQVNELVFQDKPFRSPIFGNSEPSKIISNGDTSSSGAQARKSRAALIATFTIGLIVIGSAMYAHRKGKLSKLPIKLDKLRSLSAPIRQRFNGQRLRSISESMRVKLSQSFSSSDQGSRSSSDQESSGGRARTWSGSYRRYPPGGLKPAALQKQPAFSKDFLKSPRSDDQSFAVSVGGDYDVPDEYDFQATPMSQLYGGRTKTQSTPSSAPESPAEEFSMPDDYNTVADSIYSRNPSVMGGAHRQQRPLSGRAIAPPGREQIRKPNPFLSPTTSAPSSADDMMSPRDQPYLDEWSMNSFTTSSPNNGTQATNPSPPYRHWNEKPRGSPGSKLAMPKLS